MSTTLTRRTLFKGAVAGAIISGMGTRVARSLSAISEEGQRIPLKLGIRAASMKMVGDLNVIKTAASIPGIRGVELQATSGKVNLRDGDVVRQYKKESDRWDIRIPSLAGVWDRGINIQSPGASESLQKTIRAAEILGASVILLAFFKQNAPDMDSEASYGPVVAMLQKTARIAADVGVVLGLENSLSPADNQRLVDLVDHPAVGIYYDPHNMAHYGHVDQAIPGIKLLGKNRLSMVHVKNGRLLIEKPGPIDWPTAFREFNDIQYDGWYIYETAHESTADCVDDTRKNNAFLKSHIRMPQVSGAAAYSRMKM